MNTPLSRRTALQAAGATVLAAGLTGGLTATAAHADGRPSAPKLVTYPRPAAMPTNTSFKVRVRTAPDGDWQTLDIYRPQLAEINATTGSGKIYNSSMAYFDFQGSVEVEVTYLKGGTTKARVRPDSLRHQARTRSATPCVFTLDEPKDVVVQINDEIFDCLHVITNHIDHAPCTADDPDVIYFGPGVHTVTGNVLTVPSGKTVHLAGGAVLQAQVFFKNVEKATLKGHGVLNGGPGAHPLRGQQEHPRRERHHHEPQRLRRHVRHERERARQKGARVQLEGQRRRLRRLLLDRNHLRRLLHAQLRRLHRHLLPPLGLLRRHQEHHHPELHPLGGRRPPDQRRHARQHRQPRDA